MALSSHSGSPVDLLTGKATFITGVERDRFEPALLRVYVGPRYHHIFFTVTDPDDQAEMERLWRNESLQIYINVRMLPELLQEVPPPR